MGQTAVSPSLPAADSMKHDSMSTQSPPALRQRRGEAPTALAGKELKQKQAALRAPLADHATPVPEPTPLLAWRGGLAAVLLACGAWAYLPTLLTLAKTWAAVSDYWHGHLVLPMALAILWTRRDRYPGLRSTAPLLAVGLLAVSLALRQGGDVFFLTFLDGWSLLPWAAAVAALVGGWPLLKWCWPAIALLIFLVPLPFSIEHELSAPLQRVATEVSTATLQVLGQPAFSEGNVILLGDERLEVANVCSGLRLFTGIVFLTFAVLFVIRRPWWEKAVIVAAAAPVAILANSGRIVVTGLVWQATDSETIRQWLHDSVGVGMLVFAAAAFWLLLRYMRCLVQEEQVMDMSAVIKQMRV